MVPQRYFLDAYELIDVDFVHVHRDGRLHPSPNCWFRLPHDLHFVFPSSLASASQRSFSTMFSLPLLFINLLCRSAHVFRSAGAGCRGCGHTTGIDSFRNSARVSSSLTKPLVGTDQGRMENCISAAV